jgi:hypothetical protein
MAMAARPVIPRKHLKERIDASGYIQDVVVVTLQEIIEEDHYGLEKLLAERLVGTDLQEKLVNMSYVIIGAQHQTIWMKVRGSTRLITSTI